MKKILFLFAAAFAMLLTACNGCKPEPVDPTEDVVLIKTDVLEEIIPQVRECVLKQYPAFEFYEADFVMKTLPDSTIGVDRNNNFRIAFGNPRAAETVLATIANDTLKLEYVKSPWLEDVFMTPFVPLTLDEAVNEIQKTLGYTFKVDGLPGCLRFQLLPYNSLCQGQFLIGTFMDCHSITVYTREVDIRFGNDKKLVNCEAGLKKEDAE